MPYYIIWYSSTTHHSPFPAPCHAPLLLPPTPPSSLAQPRCRCIHEPLLLSHGWGRDISAPAVPAAGLDALAPTGAGAPRASPPPAKKKKSKPKTPRIIQKVERRVFFLSWPPSAPRSCVFHYSLVTGNQLRVGVMAQTAMWSNETASGGSSEKNQNIASCIYVSIYQQQA